jgi:hypothetical protein
VAPSGPGFDGGTADGAIAPPTTSVVTRISSGECLPEPLTMDPHGKVGCTAFEALPSPGDESVCNGITGRSVPDPETLAYLRRMASLNPSMPVCRIAQLPGSSVAGGGCATSAEAGWCYLSGAAANACEQTFAFSKSGTPEVGATVWMDCEE